MKQLSIQRIMGLMIALALLFTALAIQPVSAAGLIIVNTANDDLTAGDGLCTLREAINNANADADTTSGDCAPGSGTDTITFASNYTITLAGSQLPAISSPVVITGNGPSNTILQAAATPNTATYRVMVVDAPGNLTLNGVTIQYGVCDTACEVTPQHGGGIYNIGALTVNNSYFRMNRAAGGSGGGIYNQGVLTVTGSTFEGNYAKDWGGGLITVAGTTEVANNTFSNNQVVFGTGGGITVYGAVATLRNNTISGNIKGGLSVTTDSTIYLYNNIVANSTSAPDCDSAVSFSANVKNLIEDQSCGNVAYLSGDPNLGALAYNGGPTLTHALQAGSIAIDQGSDANSLPTDQRGVSRPQNAFSDIGAYELDTTAPSLVSFARQTPAGSDTNADSLVFRVTFSEAVQNVTTGDFAVNGTTTATVTAVGAFSSSVYDVTVSGGDLAAFNGAVSIDLAGAQDITDLAVNPLPAGDPTIDESYTLDNIAPDTTLSSFPANPTNLPSASFEFSSTDISATFECSLDSALFSSCSSPAQYNSLGDGPHTFEVRAKDSAGNVDATAETYAWSIDATAPETSLDGTPADPSGVNVNFDFSSPDLTATFECQMDTGGYAACTSPKNYPSLVGGEHTFYVRAKDPLGNTDVTPAFFTWTVDANLPSVLSITRVGTALTNADSVQFTVTFSESVTGVNTSAPFSDFALTTTGLTGASITAVSGSGSTYTVTANTGTGTGTLRLDLADDDTIRDATNNPLGGAGLGNGDFSTGETYTVSKLVNLIGDYNGDGKDDIAVYRPSNGTWYVKGMAPVVWGITGDMPIPADYNGDGKAEIAVYRPSNGTWYIKGVGSVVWGIAGDMPVPADYNGDGKAEVAVYRSSNGTWYIKGMTPVVWGITGDMPIPADYNGDGKAETAVYRSSNGTWYVKGMAPVVWGIAGDMPLPADYNGDGKDDIVVYRPSNGTWYFKGTGSVVWGITGDMPVQADYNGDGKDDIAVYRPSNGTWYVKGISRTIWGIVNDIPVMPEMSN